MISYSPQSMRAYAALYAPYNDIDIFVEDGSLIGVYERVFSRLVRKGMRVAAVIPLGGKRAVLQEAERTNGDMSRRRFFLLDGDFDWSIGKKRRIPRLYYLKCYSFENFAWDYAAILKTACSLSPGMLETQITAALSEHSLKEHISNLLPLFVVYGASYKVGGTHQTVSFSVNRLFSDNLRAELCSIKIRRRMMELYRLLVADVGLDGVRMARKKTANKLASSGFGDARFVSGKNYLLPILLREFQRKFDYRGRGDQLLSLILEHSGLNVDRGLKAAVRAACL